MSEEAIVNPNKISWRSQMMSMSQNINILSMCYTHAIMFNSLCYGHLTDHSCATSHNLEARVFHLAIYQNWFLLCLFPLFVCWLQREVQIIFFYDVFKTFTFWVCFSLFVMKLLYFEKSKPGVFRFSKFRALNKKINTFWTSKI